MKVFLTAGEPSGDALGAALIAGLKSLAPSVTFRGVAGPRMQAAGMESLFAMEELSVMGITEVLPKYFALKRRIAQTAAAALEWSPDLVVTIDSPDFSLRVARLIKDARPAFQKHITRFGQTIVERIIRVIKPARDRHIAVAPL
ncbi:MAG: hypothetical protein AAF647_03955, partial [Pseudomonadota bacterium]